ncbi:hypothetical protein MUA01_08305 [Enterobacteriaceae bacterium H18W14]|uniref:hypothetical protein n=1 Tax=Dryocola boscaweniae TaxID=2925397 RepID=UPI0022F02B53|nr:hypothetical protein [Dryocola boscaweniae]MCT4714978.1 hypothetical protein [Dryocola boscaweniae]
MLKIIHCRLLRISHNLILRLMYMASNIYGKCFAVAGDLLPLLLKEALSDEKFSKSNHIEQGVLPGNMPFWGHRLFLFSKILFENIDCTLG